MSIKSTNNEYLHDIADEPRYYKKTNNQLLEKIAVDISEQKTYGSFVNVRDFGAVGDSVNDDTESIQNAIDHCLESGRLNLFMPSGNYRVTKPLLLKLKTVDWWWIGYAVKIFGDGMASTRIFKDNSTKYQDSDTTIMLINMSNPGGSGTGIGIRDLYIENESTDEDATAISGSSCSRMNIDNINIVSQRGIVFDDSFSNRFRNIVFRCKKNAFVIERGTSNTMEFLYAPSCHDPYIIRSAYSNMLSVCCDNGTGTIFDVSGGVSMHGCGAESPKAKYIVKCDSAGRNSRVYISSMFIHRQTGDSDNGLSLNDCAVIYSTGSVVMESLEILEQSYVEGSSFLLESPDYSSSSLSMGRIFYYKNYEGDDNDRLKYSKNPTASYSYGKLSVDGSSSVALRRNFQQPYLGTKGVSNSVQSNIIDKAIFLDNSTKYTDSEGNDYQWSNKYDTGDVLLINDPGAMNILGYSVTNSGETYVRDGTYAEIPIVIRRDTPNRPSNNLYIGMCVFDTSLGQPIWYDGGQWVDSQGNTV